MADTTVRWLNETELQAWRALIQTTTGLMATLDNELQAAHGLSLGDYEVLVILSEAPEHAMRMSDLASKLRLSPSGITRRIDGLARPTVKFALENHLVHLAGLLPPGVLRITAEYL